MKMIAWTLWFSFIGFWVTFLCVAGDNLSSSNTNKADSLWQLVMQSESPIALSYALEQCKLLSWQDQKDLLDCCIRQLNTSDGNLKFVASASHTRLGESLLSSNVVEVGNPFLERSGLLTRRGRGIWLASQLLGSPLQEADEGSAQVDAAVVSRKILELRRMVDSKRYEQELAKLQYCLRLAKDERLALARSQETDRRVLAVLANDTDVEVRRWVAANYKTPDKTVVKMWNSDSDATVRGSAQSNAILVKSFRLNTKPGYIPPAPKKRDETSVRSFHPGP